MRDDSGSDSLGARCLAPAPSPRRIPLRRRAAFILVIWAAIAVIQEVFFRLVFPFPEVVHFSRNNYALSLPSKTQGAAHHDRDVHEEAMRHKTLRFESEPDGFAFVHRLNLYGFRGDDFAIAPPRQRARVLFLGDSFVEGMGAAQSDTIPAQFAAAVGHRAEALNLGVSGAGFPEYVRMVRDAVPLLRPDEVFLFIYANDLPAPPYPEQADQPPPRMPRLSPYRPRAWDLLWRLKQGLPVARAFQTGPFPYFEAVPSPVNPWTNAQPPQGIDPAILRSMRQGRCSPFLPIIFAFLPFQIQHEFTQGGGVEKYLYRMQAICRRSGAHLTVVYIPLAATINPTYIPPMEQFGLPPAVRAFWRTTPTGAPILRRQQAHLKAATRSLGIAFLDLTDDYLIAEKTCGRMFWLYDNHCNAAGYRLAAEMCARSWIERARAGERPTAGLH